jgi:hypothetical protein
MTGSAAHRLRIGNVLLVLCSFGLTACATVRPTSQQQLARTVWDSCPKTANIALTSIDADGFIEYRAVSSALGARQLLDCLTARGVRTLATPVLSLAP